MSVYPKKRRKLSKKESERKHAIRRAKERYNIDLTSGDIKQLIRAIQTGQATYVRRLSNRVTKWSIPVPKHLAEKSLYPEMIVVYDKERKEIATFLPK
ncbi:MAG: hypothetical protein WAX66_00610 [Patescibacteria group bacterium]